MIEKAIYNILSNTVGLAGVQIYFGTIPQVNGQSNSSSGNSNPYIVFYRNGTTPYDSKSGRSTLDDADMQCNIFANSADTVATYAETVRGALDRTSGTFNGIVVQSIQFTNEATMFEFNDTYNTKGLFQISQYYSCRVQPVYL
tara:strand:+ start:2141 stop:2569 length:429 start_codon:yes stop_codon:yes gene_type:complete